MNKRSGNQFNSSKIALESFINEFGQSSNLGELDFFSAIYYPIALIEVDLTEFSTEEFEIIEKVILSIYKAGIKSPNDISSMLGVTSKYVDKILSLLEGYGHIENGNVTQLGIRSLEEGIKYTKYKTRQKVQVDILTQNLLTKEMNQRGEYVLEENDLKPYYYKILTEGIVNYSTLTSMNKDLKKFKHTKSSVFSINVESIDEIGERELKYTYAFLVSFKNLKCPIIILKNIRYNPIKKRNEHYFSPLYICNEDTHLFNSDIFKNVKVIDKESFKDIIIAKENQVKNVEEGIGNKGKLIMKFKDLLGIDYNKVNIRVEGTKIYIEGAEDECYFENSWVKKNEVQKNSPILRLCTDGSYSGVVLYLN